MALGKPAVLTPKALDLRAVQGTVNAIRERLQFIEQSILLAAAQANSSTVAAGVATLQLQLAQLTARVTAVEGLVGGSGDLDLIAGSDIAAGDPVVMVGLNLCAPVDVTDPTAIYAVVGLAQTAAATGQSVAVTNLGSVSFTDGTFEAGRAVYANVGGGVTQYPSYSDVAIPVGVATGATTVWVSPAWPAMRALGFESGYEDFIPSTTGLVRDAVLLTDDFNAEGAGLVVKTGENNVVTRTLVGTAARVAVSNGSGVAGNPTVDIDAAYVGQTSITTVGTIGVGTWAGTAVAADHGGTGQTSYAVGDLIYANTTTTLAKLPDVVTGNAVISGGVNTAPAWGKIGLTTHVDGVLPEANGGTGSATRPYVLLAGDTMTGDLVISKATAPVFALDPTSSGVQAQLQFRTAGLTRWLFRKDNAVESGSNVGSNFGIRRYNDAGTFIEDALLINRATGNVTIAQGLTVSNGVTGSLTGNASTATALQTARNINGVSFNGTADVTVPAAAGTLTGATLAAGVTTSSLTSVGTLGSLTVSGTATGGAFTPTSSSVPTNGMYLYTTNAVGWSVNSVAAMFLSAAGNLGIGIAPVSGVRLQVRVGADQNVSCLSLGGGAAIGGLTDAGSSSAFRVYGNTVTLSGNASTDHVTLASNGQLSILVAGRGLSIREGSNAKMGVATLVAGTVVVSTTAVTASSRIFLAYQSFGTIVLPSSLGVSARTAGANFTITSAAATDTSAVAWVIFEPS